MIAHDHPHPADVGCCAGAGVELTRRRLLTALAAGSLAGCAGDAPERSSTVATPEQPTAAAEPKWTSAVPTIAFSEGSLMAYDLRRHTQDFDPRRHEMALATPAALGRGITLDPAGWLRYDGVRPGASVAGIVIEIRDRIRATAPAANPAAPTSSGLVAFAARSASPGVMRHFAFDSAAHLGAGPNGFGYGYNHGWYPGIDNDDRPVIDSAMSPTPGGRGSLKMTMDGRRGGGLWACNFSEDLKTRFNAGDEFFVQWRQRFNASMIGSNTDVYGTWKQCLISSGDVDYTVAGIANSCRCIEICLQSYALPLGADDAHNDRFPIAYHRCPNCGGTVNLTESHPGQFELLQNKRPAPYCGYNNILGSGAGVGPPGGNCFVYVADEWLTFQIGVTCGQRVGEELPGSRVRVWTQREGRPSEPLIDRALTLTFPSNDPGYGKFWFTTRNPHDRNTTMVTWMAELIISRQRIPDAL